MTIYIYIERVCVCLWGDNVTLIKNICIVLSVFPWRPMPPAAHSRLCSRDSAWVGVFARSGMSSVQPVSVIVRAGYRLLLAFSRVRPFSFNKSIDIRSTQSRQIINLYSADGALLQHMQSVSLSGERTFTFLFSQNIIMTATFFLGCTYAKIIYSISSQCMESNAH